MVSMPPGSGSSNTRVEPPAAGTSTPPAACSSSGASGAGAVGGAPGRDGASAPESSGEAASRARRPRPRLRQQRGEAASTARRRRCGRGRGRRMQPGNRMIQATSSRPMSASERSSSRPARRRPRTTARCARTPAACARFDSPCSSASSVASLGCTVHLLERARKAWPARTSVVPRCLGEVERRGDLAVAVAGVAEEQRLAISGWTTPSAARGPRGRAPRAQVGGRVGGRRAGRGAGGCSVSSRSCRVPAPLVAKEVVRDRDQPASRLVRHRASPVQSHERSPARCQRPVRSRR